MSAPDLLVFVMAGVCAGFGLAIVVAALFGRGDQTVGSGSLVAAIGILMMTMGLLAYRLVWWSVP